MIPRNAVEQNRQVFTDLVRFQIELLNAVDSRMRADAGFPLGSFQALQIIGATPHARVFDIAEQLVITIGGASKLVDRIEARGQVERRAHPSDRRSSLLVLTAQGRADLAAGDLVLDDELAIRLGASLSPDELGQLGATLHSLRPGAGLSHSPKDES